VLLPTIIQATFLIVFYWFWANDATVLYTNPLVLRPRELNKIKSKTYKMLLGNQDLI